MVRTVLAAGGVVWRRGTHGIEVALVHRPRYDDWSLPKGKLAEGESPIEAAVREIGEELGSRVTLSRRLRTVSYDIADASKKVTYWSALVREGAFLPNDEVDDVRWLPVAHARAELSYDADRLVLSDFAALPVPDSVVVLLRHAKAGKRAQWDGDDRHRPLDDTGRWQAERLVALLRPFAPTRIRSADRVRCVQTVEPLADALGLPVIVDSAFSDDAYAASPDAAKSALLGLAVPDEVTVISSQGDAIPGLIEQVAPALRSTHTRKGGWWTLSLVDGVVLSADYYDPP